MTAHVLKSMKQSTHNTGSFIIKFKGSYNIASAGDILDSLQNILDEISFATFTIEHFVLGDKDFCVEVFCHANKVLTRPEIAENLYSTLRCKLANVTVE